MPQQPRSIMLLFVLLKKRKSLTFSFLVAMLLNPLSLKRHLPVRENAASLSFRRRLCPPIAPQSPFRRRGRCCGLRCSAAQKISIAGRTSQARKLSHWLTRMQSNGISPRADQKVICRQLLRFRRYAFLTRIFLPPISRNEPETTVNRSLSNSLTSSSKRRSHTFRIIRRLLFIMII